MATHLPPWPDPSRDLRRFTPEVVAVPWFGARSPLCPARSLCRPWFVRQLREMPPRRILKIGSSRRNQRIATTGTSRIWAWTPCACTPSCTNNRSMRTKLCSLPLRDGALRSKEAEKQGNHRVIMRDGETCRPGQLSIIATVGNHTSRMTSWRGTGDRKSPNGSACRVHDRANESAGAAQLPEGACLGRSSGGQLARHHQSAGRPSPLTNTSNLNARSAAACSGRGTRSARRSVLSSSVLYCSPMTT